MVELGTLTRKQFNDEITSFIEKADLLNENWCIRQHEVSGTLLQVCCSEDRKPRIK